MVQDQLTDYISSQIKLGVPRDAIKSALVSAGWVTGDVENTLKKVEGSAPAQPVAATAVAKPATTVTAPAGAKTADPQMIRVSDLVSGTAATSPTAFGTSAKKDGSMFGGKITGNSFEATPSNGKTSATSSEKKNPIILEIIGVILILGLGGLAWYFYMGQSDLNAKIASLNSSSATLSSQLTSLQSQVNASSTADAAEIASLSAANADLALNLSFYAVPIGTPTSTAATPLPITISGSLSGGSKAPYALTTPRGAKIFVSNSNVASTSVQLKPLIGQTIQLSGTYVEGSDAMMVTSIATTTSQ